ncbi:MAG: carbohydrate-binding family 9-like protein [Victivallales bacterium]|nr:carbohydrate-binding family 9-like protein [Victivallales bacterium]
MISRALLTILCVGTFSASAWQEDFGEGAGKATPYYTKGERSVVTVADGYLKVVLPGKRPLEGVRLMATGLTGGRLSTVTARVRGKGEAWLCLNDGRTWLYAPKTVSLTGVWQEISLQRVIRRETKTLSVNFLAKTVQTGAVFEIDDVTVEQGALPALGDASVPPVRMEAEAFAMRPKEVMEHEGAKSIGGTSYTRCQNLPVPRTSRLVVVRARVYAAGATDRFRLCTVVNGVTQVLFEAKAPETGRWLWLRFPPIAFGETAGTLAMDVIRKERNGQTVAIDAIVLCSEDRAEDDPEAAQPLLPDAPTVQVGRCAQPPALDGKPDDACWREAIVCTDFLRVRSRDRAEQNTSVRFCYDDTRLYALFECEESILGVAQQRRHEFRASEKTRDGRVYKDSACLLLLDPAGDGKQLYEVGVNGLGTVLDALCEAPSYWTSRDLGWTADVKTGVQTGDGTWSVELSIPFEALGTAAPKPGTSWQVVPGRIAAARKESSSWSASDVGFHAPGQMGRLVFTDVVPGLALRTPARWQSGGNAVTAEVMTAKKRPAGFLAATTLDFGKAIANHWLPVPGAAATHTVTVPVSREGALQLRQGMLDAATLAPLYVRPGVQRAVRSCSATLTLTCAGAYEVFLNGESLARGKDATASAVKLPLAQGANTIALRVAQGLAYANLACPGMPAGKVAWKVTPKPDEKSVLPAANDSAWATATPGGDGRIGLAGQPVVLRHTLVWESTRPWPAAKPALYLARGIPQQFIAVFDTERRVLRDWTLYLAVPPSFRVLGSTGYYAKTREDYPSFPSEYVGTTTLDGKKYRLTKITASAPLRRGSHAIFTICNVLVEATAEAKLDQPHQFIYWAEANGGAWAEIPQVVPVQVLPELRGKQPKKLVWQLWGSFFGPMDDETVKEDYLRLAQAAGFNDLVTGDRWTSDHAPKYGIRNTKGVRFVSWSIDLKDFLEARPDWQLLGSNGGRSTQYMCTTQLLQDSGWEPVHSCFAKMIEESKPDTLDYDFEYAPFAGPHSCYCNACLAAFRSYAKLPGNAELTPKTIKTAHRAQWVTFMADRVAQVFRRMRVSIDEISPGCEFSVYSGYHGPGNMEQYGVDWARIGELKSCHRAACGYGRPAERVRDTVTALKGIPLVCGELLNPYNTQVDEAVIPLTVGCLLRRSLDATGGVLVYDRLPMDGRCWQAVGETTRLVATHEELFLKGTRSTLPGQPEDSVTMLTHGDQALLCVLNAVFQKRTFRLKAPFAAREFYTGAAVKAGQTLNVVLSPGQAAVYVKTP